MTNFEISFTDEGNCGGLLPPLQCLRLTLGAATEHMEADLSTWSRSDYHKHWLYELNGIVSTRDRGALITSMHDPKMARFVVTWPMWRKSGLIHFQNKLLFMETLHPRFDPVDVVDYIGEHSSRSREGERISEWIVSVDAISNFLQTDPFLIEEPKIREVRD
jgi:hypothetical protein